MEKTAGPKGALKALRNIIKNTPGALKGAMRNNPREVAEVAGIGAVGAIGTGYHMAKGASDEQSYEFGFQDELEKIAKIRPGALVSKLKGFLKGKKPPVPTKRFVRMGIPGELTPTRMNKWRGAMQKADVAGVKAMRTPVSELPPFLRVGMKQPL